jgi:hypothetical protein
VKLKESIENEYFRILIYEAGVCDLLDLKKGENFNLNLE